VAGAAQPTGPVVKRDKQMVLCLDGATAEEGMSK
jgi:hypothetical protein